MQLGVLLKGAKAYTEAVKAYDDVLLTNPDYGPVYRELAETYYYWAKNEPKNYNSYIQKALTYYENYMKLTDYSLASRMRHADFLILAKDYKALELEANAMKALDKVNPRILRYLSYSAFENGNTELAQKSIQDFLANPNNKKIIRVVLLVIGAYVAYRIVKGVVKATPQREEEQAGMNELDILNLNSATKQKITKQQAESFANVLFTAMDGYGTDEDTIAGVFKQMKNNADFAGISAAYGVRELSSGRMNPEPNYKGGLSGALASELSQSWKDIINKDLASRKITYKI
jgi:hypothetical protein